jgi:hypothetical protein
MVDIAAPLTPHRVEVLRWVEAGCPDSGMPGEGAKHTARALQGRRLVTVSRRDGRWSAALTERGRYYLDNGRYPELTGTASGDPSESPTAQTASGGKGRQPTVQPAVIHEATVLIERRGQVVHGRARRRPSRFVTYILVTPPDGPPLDRPPGQVRAGGRSEKRPAATQAPHFGRLN